MASNLDSEFKIAFDKVSEVRQKLAPDTMLRLYAYYKQAVRGDNFSFNAHKDIKSAFKFNAWIQLQGMTEDEAKQEYINLVNTILK